MTPERLSIIKSSLDRRQTDLTVVMENVRKPHNLAAVARTLEAVGGLEIHAITRLTSIRLTQMSAGGTKKWIKVSKHPTTEQGLGYLKQKGFQIIATSLCENSKDYREVDYTRPTAILVGEELEGISEQAMQIADESISIPMAGMVQSLNVSVASALVLYEAYRQRMAAGSYDSCSLDKETYMTLLFEACHPKIANCCQQKRIPYPAIDEDAQILEPLPGSRAKSDDSFAEWCMKNTI
ncbi:MAG TPA: tRNA (guanosine(18)-2'-O)-methyltransferase TrmH [Gammaproteobacteria bacterium]|nr:tRNA (guanosine(18)-2'-O)-methyltransferase TrmH [Gammaproteobacteria bacterium]